MLGHSSAAMTLDVYADLFDGDLDAVSDALENAVSQSSVGKRLNRHSKRPRFPLQTRGTGAFSRGGDGGI